MSEKTFQPGDRVTVLKNPAGGYPEGFVPPVFAGTVVGLLADLDMEAALFAALMDEFPEREITDLPGVTVTAVGEGRASVELEVEAEQVVPLLTRHPYYVVAVDGGDSPHSQYRPDELERI